MPSFFDSLSILFVHDNITRASESDLPAQYRFDYRQPLLLLYLLYTIPSFYTYFKCRQFLTKSAITSNHFNVIFSNDFHINVALFLVDFLFTRLPISGLIVNFPDYLPSGYFLTIVYFLSYYLIYANFCSITLICFNRMTSIVFPYASSSFWTRNIHLSIALVYILPLLTTWQTLTFEAYYIPLRANYSNYQMIYQYTFIPVFIRNSAALSATSFALSIVCIFANLLTIIGYKKTIRTIETSNVNNESIRQRNKRIEVAMFAIALVVCLSLVLQSIIQAVILMSPSSKSTREIAQDLRAFSIDLSICCPPWILYYTTMSRRIGSGSSNNSNDQNGKNIAMLTVPNIQINKK